LKIVLLSAFAPLTGYKLSAALLVTGGFWLALPVAATAAISTAELQAIQQTCEAGQYNEGLDALARAGLISGDSVLEHEAAIGAAAACFAAGGMTARALEILDTAIAHSPSDTAAAVRQRGRLNLSIGRTDAALADFQYVLAGLPAASAERAPLLNDIGM
jgi:tetratricopeptide (TPR) repeat protein